MVSFWLLLICIFGDLSHSESYNGTTLTVNEAQSSTVDEGELQFYRFDVSSHSAELHVYVTPLGNCDVTLVASLSGQKYPTQSDGVDKVSRNSGAEYLIISYNEYKEESQYIYATVQGVIAGQYTILYRFMENREHSYNTLAMRDNIPQFLIINNELNGAYQMYAMMEYKLHFNANSNTKVISFYLDSYISNTVFFECWISVDKPSKWDNLNDESVLYRHLDPTVSSLRLSSNDAKAIRCTKDMNHTTAVVCHGFDADGALSSVSVPTNNNTNEVYFTIKVDASKSDMKQSQLHLIINDEPLNSDNTNPSQCQSDCGPRGQDASEQLPITHGETMWNTLMADESGIVQPEFFRYDYTANSNCNLLQIKVADIAGFTNVYVSNASLTAWPSNSSNCMKSHDLESNTQTITIANPATSTYHVGVYPASSSKHSQSVVFTISLSLTQCKKDEIVWTEIDSGIQIAGALTTQSVDYYKYTVSKPGADIVIRVLNGYTGDIDLYVKVLNSSAPNPTPPNSITSSWKDTSASNSSDSDNTISKMIEVRSDDVDNCQTFPCSYGITVHCGTYSYSYYVPDTMAGAIDRDLLQCQYQIIVSSSKSVTTLQSSQPLIDMIHKNDEKHLYEYDYYALPAIQQDDITITVTPIHWAHAHAAPDKDVNIYVSKTNPLSAYANADEIWAISNEDAEDNSLIINKSMIGPQETLWIAVVLSPAYNEDLTEEEVFEFSIICYTTQTVKLPLETPLIRSLKPQSSIVYKSVVDIGRDFSIFMAASNNVSGHIYLSNLDSSHQSPPNHEDAASFEWSTELTSHADFINQITVNYVGNDMACKSLTRSTALKCQYWITIYNPNPQKTLRCVILSTVMFHNLLNGEPIKSQVTADDADNTKRFVLNPQTMPLVAQNGDKKFNLVVSASIIIGSVMGLSIGSTPFADDLYAQFDGRDHDFAIGREIPIDRSYYIAVMAVPGDVFTLTATFIDVSSSDTSANTVTSFLEPGVSQLSILDTKELNRTHSCHIYQHPTSDPLVQLTYSSVIGGDNSVILIKRVSNNGGNADFNCDNAQHYSLLNYLYNYTAYDESIAILWGPRDSTQFEDMKTNDFLYINVYAKASVEDIDSVNGYYMEYRLLVYSTNAASPIMLFNGVPVNIDIVRNTTIYAAIPITKKMLQLNRVNGYHFIDISFTKYSFGRPVIFISSTNQKPNKLDYDYALTEDNGAQLAPYDDLYFSNWTDIDPFYATQSTFGLTIDFRHIDWPKDNNPWAAVGNVSLEEYDDEFEIDEWIGYLYLSIQCIDCYTVAIDLQSNYITKHIVSDLLYGVPMYIEIEEQGTMKYFLLDVGDTNLVYNMHSHRNDTNLVSNGTLQIALSIIAGSAELYVDIDRTGTNYPQRNDDESYTMSTLDVKDGDINSFKVIDIDLQSILSASRQSQQIIIGVEATSQFTECTMTAQQLSVAPTLLTINMAINSELSAKQSYAIYDFAVDSNDLAVNSSAEFYIIANAISGSIGLFVNAPDQYPKIPTTTAGASYYSVDPQYAFQVVHVSNSDLQSHQQRMTDDKHKRLVYRCVVALLDAKSNARFNIVVHKEIKGESQETQYIADGIPITYILSPNQRQLFKYTLSDSPSYSEQLTITMSSIFGDPSMYIGLDRIPDANDAASYNWSTSWWGVDSIRIPDANIGTYNILVYSGSQMSTQFTLTAVSSQTEHIITNGISLFETIYESDVKYYVFYPTATSTLTDTNEVSISMVSYSGDIDVFISSDGECKHPNVSCHDYSFQIDSRDSMKSQSLSIPMDPDSVDIPMYISVQPIEFETDGITYSIMITQNAIGILTDGVSVQSTLLSSSTNEKLFRFTMDKNAVHTVTITLSALRGSEDVSMIVYPTGTQLNATANITKPIYDSSQTVIIQDLCLNSLSNAGLDYTYNENLCVYLIAIHMDPDTAGATNRNHSFEFNIIANTDQTFVTLQDGVTITDSILSPNSFKYYNFYVNSVRDAGKVALEIDVNPYYGDPDLYCALNLENNKLVNTTHNWKWRSMRFGEDRIAILIKNTSSLGVYQIGVYAYSVTQYRLNGWLRPIVWNVSDTANEQAITMYPGQMRYDYSSGNVKCYVFNTDPQKDAQHQEIEVMLNVHEGSVNAYLNLNHIPNDTAHEAWFKQLTRVSSMQMASPQVLAIAPDELDWVSKVYCCIQGEPELRSLYEIQINYRTGVNRLILNGRPRPHTLHSMYYDYYSVDVVHETMPIYINVESLSDNIAAPLVYISKRNRHPSPNDTLCVSQWELNAYQSSCTMPYTDESDKRLRVILLNNIYSAATYFISIKANETQTYQIIASSTLSVIESGVSISDTLIASNWKYYVYDESNAAAIPLIITFTLISGSTRTYVSNSWITDEHYDVVNDHTVMNIDNGTDNATAIAFTASNSITISANTNAYFYCTPNSAANTHCKYYIAVRASADSRYNVAVHFEDDLYKLKNDGTPINGRLLSGHYAYYYVLLTADAEELQILLTDMDLRIDNDLIIYVNANESLNWKPNATNAQYRSSNGSLIFHNAPSGTYYISVFAVSEHYYSILATTSRIVLIENYPQVISTKYFKLKESQYGYFFSYDVLNQSGHSYDSIQFNVHSNTNSDDLFTVHVTNSEIMSGCDGMRDCPNRRTCSNSSSLCGHFVSISVDNPVILESNSVWHCKYETSAKLCTYYIGIALNEGYENKVESADNVQFDVTASSSSSTSGVLMYDGAAVTSSFSESRNEYNFYVSYIPQNKENAEIALQTCSGDSDLYVSLYNVLPTKLSAQRMSENEEKMDVVTINDLNAATSEQNKRVIYIGVRNNNNNNNNNAPSEYTLSVGYALKKYQTKIVFEDLSVSSLHAGSATVQFELKHIPSDLDQEIVSNLDPTTTIAIVGYKLYFADSSNPYTMYSQCGLQRMEEWNQCQYQSNETKSCFIDLGNPSTAGHDPFVVNNGKDYKRTIHGLRPNQTYYFNVLLQTKITNVDPSVANNNKYLYTTYYIQSCQIMDALSTKHTNNADITVLEIAFGVTIPIMFVLIALVYYYYKKHKLVARDLSVLEMEEIPINKVVKAIGGTKFTQYTSDRKFISKFSKANILRRKKGKKDRRPRNQSKNYHSLLSAHDDFSDDDDDREESFTLEIDDDDDENDRSIIT